VLSADRARIMGEIQGQVNTEARQFGIEVVDVRIRRADLPEENTQAILSRMQSERERVAREARAEGAEIGQRVRAGAERERTVLIAEAQAQSDILRGQGEQEAIRIVAEAFSKDLDFFQFWRSMQAYREAFAEGNTRMVMTPESEFFRFFRDSGGRLQPLTTSPLSTPTPTPAPANSSGSAPATPQ
jgi:membrane protease subunit HflC